MPIRRPSTACNHFAFVQGEIGEGKGVLTRLHRANVIADLFGGGQSHPGVAGALPRGRVAACSSTCATAPPACRCSRSTTRRRPRNPPRQQQWREVGLGAQILRDLGVSSIVNLSSTPRSYVGLGRVRHRDRAAPSRWRGRAGCSRRASPSRAPHQRHHMRADRARRGPRGRSRLRAATRRGRPQNLSARSMSCAVAQPKSASSEVEVGQRVAQMRVEAGRDDDEIRPERSRCAAGCRPRRPRGTPRPPSPARRGTLTMVSCSPRLVRRARAGVERHLVRRAVHDAQGRPRRCPACRCRGGRPSRRWRRGRRRTPSRVAGGDRGVVEEAEAHRRGAARRGGRAGATPTKAFGTLPVITSSTARIAPPTAAQRGLERAGRHGGVVVELHQAVLRRGAPRARAHSARGARAAAIRSSATGRGLARQRLEALMLQDPLDARACGPAARDGPGGVWCLSKARMRDVEGAHGASPAI